MSRSIWEKAKKLADQKQVVLGNVEMGYSSWYGDSKLILHAEGRYLTKGNDGYAVRILCSKDRVEKIQKKLKKLKKTVDKSFTMR